MGQELRELLCVEMRQPVDTSRALALIAAGADTGFDADHCNSPLLLAAYLDNVPVMEALLDKGAPVDGADRFGWSPLMIAANNGHTAAAQLLVDRGADIHAAGNKGETPYNLATAKNFPAVQQILVAAERERQRREAEAEALTGTFNAAAVSAVAGAQDAPHPISLLKPLQLRRLAAP
jgi:ankyrin repeat protein